MNTLRTFREGILNGLLIMQRPPTKYVANTPSGVGADSSRPYPDIIKYTYPFHRIRILTLSNTYIHFTTHVFFSPFCGCFHIRGHDKSAPTAACGLPLRCERIAKTLRTPTKYTRNTYEMGCEHSENTHETFR